MYMGQRQPWLMDEVRGCAGTGRWGKPSRSLETFQLRERLHGAEGKERTFSARLRSGWSSG